MLRIVLDDTRGDDNTRRADSKEFAFLLLLDGAALSGNSKTGTLIKIHTVL